MTALALSENTIEIRDAASHRLGDERSLVVAARDGDIEAFTQLYRHYVGPVFGYCMRRLSNREAAEEATQEIFIRALQGLPRMRDEALFGGWLFGIARHVMNDHYRARKTAPLTGLQMPETVDLAQSPHERLEARETHDLLLAAREQCLSAGDRQLLDLLMADLTDREIATALGRRYGAIRTAHCRLLQRLRRCLEATTAKESSNAR